MTKATREALDRAIQEYAALRVHASDVRFNSPEYHQVISEQIAAMERIKEILDGEEDDS